MVPNNFLTASWILILFCSGLFGVPLSHCVYSTWPMKLKGHTVPVRRFTDVQVSVRCWRHFCSHYLLSIFILSFTPVVVYGCETWSLISREERRLRVFENRVLRGIFWPKREEQIGDRRKIPQWGASWFVLLTYYYYYGDEIEKNEMGGSCGTRKGEDKCLPGFDRETWGQETVRKT